MIRVAREGGSLPSWRSCEKAEKFDEVNSISGAILNEFKRKNWEEEKNRRGGRGGRGGYATCHFRKRYDKAKAIRYTKKYSDSATVPNFWLLKIVVV